MWFLGRVDFSENILCNALYHEDFGGKNLGRALEKVKQALTNTLNRTRDYG